MAHVVYIHTCKVNGKCYVGITNKTAEERFVEHCLAAKRGSKFAFHAAIRKYGEDAWDTDVVATVESRDEAHELEVRHIAERRATERKFGYNMTAGGDGIVGLERSADHCKAISESLKGHSVSNETRAKLSRYRGERASFYGRKQSQEWRDKIAHIMATNHPMKGMRGEKSPFASTFIVTTPTGDEIEITGLSEWCRQNGLTHSAMSLVASGKRKHHKGYLCRRK